MNVMRQVDIPLSTSMYRWVVNEERWLNLSDVRHVAPELWRSLCRLRRVADRARTIAADSRHTLEQRTQMVRRHLLLLCYYFTTRSKLYKFTAETQSIQHVDVFLCVTDQ